MASSAKTEKLRLNSWSGEDRPKREDFNTDNSIIDSVLGGHIADGGIHLTKEEKQRISAPYKTGSYIGTGESEKTLTLSAKPKAVLVFASNKPLVWLDSAGKLNAGSGASIDTYHTPGVQISGSGFKVSNAEATAQQDWNTSLNKIGVTYFYIAFA